MFNIETFRKPARSTCHGPGDGASRVRAVNISISAITSQADTGSSSSNAILNTLPRTEQCPALRLQEEDVNTAISQRSVFVTVAQARCRLRDRVSGRPRLGKSALEGNTDSLPSYDTLFPNNTTEDVFVAPLILLRYISLRPDTAS